jgi:probable HAF family extracellular repeat protein
MKFNKLACSLALLFTASTCFAQMQTVTDIGPLGDMGSVWGINSSGQSIGWTINAFGQVVGYSENGNLDIHAFIYDGGAMYDLNSLIPAGSGELFAAYGINDGGPIVGSGTLDGQEYAFLLTPVYEASVRPPIRTDGQSRFQGK